MPHAYTEDQLVEQPVIGLFAEIGWTTVSALEETFGATGTLLRETNGEVVLVSRLRAALERLNPAPPPEAISGFPAIRQPRTVNQLGTDEAHRSQYDTLALPTWKQMQSKMMGPPTPMQQLGWPSSSHPRTSTNTCSAPASGLWSFALTGWHVLRRAEGADSLPVEGRGDGTSRRARAG